MLRKNLFRCAVAVVLAVPFYSSADSFKVKPGAWEMTTTTVTSGSMMPPDVLAKMPPEQRAKMEATMNARAGKPTSHVTKSCVTQKDLDEDRMTKSDDDQSCTKKIISKSATKLVMERTCAAPKPSKMTLTQEAKTPESVVVSMDMVQGASGGKVHVNMVGRWLGASCKGIDKDS
ncbi:MAG: DUF3617 domain-containing protein [Burkholderiales bacterium]